MKKLLLVRRFPVQRASESVMKIMLHRPPVRDLPKIRERPSTERLVRLCRVDFPDSLQRREIRAPDFDAAAVRGLENVDIAASILRGHFISAHRFR